jgi:threonine/homoserine/homoserine lactone efflux protein
VSWETLGPFVVAALVVQLVPGPGMLFILANGIAGGPRAGIAAALGAASGMVVHTFAAALGLAALFRALPAAYTTLRIAGGLYLLWIAASHLRAARRRSAEPVAAPRRSSRRVFVRALANNLANPKVILFYLAFLPQFVDRSAGAATAQFVALGFAFLLIGLVVDVAIGAASGRIGDLLRRRIGLRRALDAASGTILGALGVRVLASDARP